jgi:hypothetical protein
VLEEVEYRGWLHGGRAGSHREKTHGDVSHFRPGGYVGVSQVQPVPRVGGNLLRPSPWRFTVKRLHSSFLRPAAQALPADFRSRNLRVHDFLHDVPLQDVWEIRLRGGGDGRTIHDLRPLFNFAALEAINPVVKGLLGLRWQLGTLFGWDRERPSWSADSYLHRLTPDDRNQSRITPGTPDGPFCTLYVFEHEQLSEVRNATVHAFSSLSIEPAEGGYLVYWAIHVKPVSRFTGLYMTAIAPFRHFLVYPAIIRQVQRTWVERYGVESAGGTPGSGRECVAERLPGTEGRS